MIQYYIIAVLCGIFVAAAEILSKHRKEPFKALRCNWGITYILFNGLIPVAGLAIATAAGIVSISSTSFDNLLNSLYVGFGSLAIIHAKIFNFTIDGNEKPIGPEFFVEIFRTTVDREI